MMNKKLVYSVLGNTLEWYCYSLYGGFIINILYHFFGKDNCEINLIFTYIIFAIGFISRPIGAVIFGHIGDKIGREKVLCTSLLLMSISTFSICIIPSFEVLGFFSTILLVIARGIQGIAIGGQYTGVMVYLVEQAPSNVRGLYGCFAEVGCIAGTLLGGSITSLAITKIMNGCQYSSYAWKIPFFLAVFVGILGLLIAKNKKDESNSEQDYAATTNVLAEVEQSSKIPIVELFTKYKGTMIYSSLSAAFSGVNFYTLLVFLPNYIVLHDIGKHVDAFANTRNSLLAMLVCVVFSGYISDKMTHKSVLILGILGVMVVVFPSFKYLDCSILQIVYGAFMGLYYGGRAAFFSEAFPRKIRCTAVSFSLSISHCLFSGSAPMVAELISQNFGLQWISIYIIIVSVFTLYGFTKIRDRTGEPLL